MKVLILRTGAMGDVVHTLPAVAALRRARPGWEVHWLVEERWAALLGEPMVDRVIAAGFRGWSREPWAGSTRRSLAEVRARLRAERYALAVDLQGTIRSGLLGFLAGAGRLCGWRDPREMPARWFYGEAFGREGRHFAEQTTALLGAAAGVELTPGRVEFPVHAAEEAWAEERVVEPGAGRLAVLAPGAGWAAKQWPAARFGELARGLREGGFRGAVNAVGAGDPLAAAVVRASGGAAEAVAMTVGQMVALLRRTALVVGGDSGPLHVAAALGVPVVGLYGPTDPARNGPWGEGRVAVLRDAASVTSYKRAAGVDAGLERVPVEAVLEAVGRVSGAFS